MRNDIITDDFALALSDYAYLLNKAYPRKTILKVVGDRYLLNSFQRILLSRGVFPEYDVRKRIQKTRSDVKGEELYIDGYNVLFTICNYLLGRMVFLANDRFIRDTGEVYGKPQEDLVFARGIELCLNYLKKSKPSRVEFFFDSPVSRSAELAGEFREMIGDVGLIGNAEIDKNPDARLIRQNCGIIATSDSDILDNADQPIIDLAHLILIDSFELHIPDLGDMLK